MTIQITRGPRGDGSPIISFIGRDSNNQQPSDLFSFVQTISPQINSVNTDNVDISDVSGTLTNGYPTYVLFDVPYTDWVDRDLNTFANASEVVNYIRGQLDTSINIIQERSFALSGISSTITVGVNSFFEFDASYQKASGYFWDRSTIPNGLDVSRYDRRKLSGIITTTGSYQVFYEVSNVNGAVNTNVTINVV